MRDERARGPTGTLWPWPGIVWSVLAPSVLLTTTACSNGAGAGGAQPLGGGGDASGSGAQDAAAGAGGTTVSSGGGGSPSESRPLGREGLAARLSKFEYKNSILDVLGVTLLPEELDEKTGGIPNDTGDGVFKHLADNQTSVEQHALSYFRVAEAVSQRIPEARLRAGSESCTLATENCGAQIANSLGRRLFRRPLDEREQAAMLQVYRAAADEGLDHDQAARWTVVALLQAPQFLFKMEDETRGVVGEPRNLDGYELAARLAAFLWVSVPDDELLDTAMDDALLESAALEAEVSRMLADPKAERFTEVFATDFSRARFSSFEGSTDEDREALNRSIIATFQNHFWTEQGSIAELFTTTRFVINETVAGLLGLPREGAEELWTVDVADLPQRVGLMSHPSMIAGMGDRVVGSFVNRGKYLMERLLCRHPIAFPGDITTQIEQFNADTTGLNEREKAEIRMTRVECWACHQQFEPLAFGFSRFDGAGRYVGETDEDGKPLPLDGWVPTGEADQPLYEDVPSYMDVLATDPIVQNCMTEHFIDFATSRIGDEIGRLEAERVGEEYRAEGSTLAAMVMAVVRSPLFNTTLTSGEEPAP